MLPRLSAMRRIIRQSISSDRAEGQDVDGLEIELASVPDSYDALIAFARRVADAPIRNDWPYVEPDDLPAIWRECDPARPLDFPAEIDPADAAARVEAAFLSSVCGCILGKPLEINPTLAEIRDALEARGEWPMNDYISRDLNMRGKRAFHPDAHHTCRENITYAAPDDDINYTILGMLNLEQHGPGFSHDQLRTLWLRHQSVAFTWGPERTLMALAAMKYWTDDFDPNPTPPDYHAWTHICNPHGELCGALIRADAYGYACPGRPALAAELAHRDASLTHRRTGVYGTMFVAAAIAAAFVERDRLRIFEIALRFIPRRSRFHHIITDSLQQVRQASGWLDGYHRIHNRYKQYSHCQIYQECGTLINSLRFAENIGHGLCMQVSQGNDTDSFGATCGSILGAYFGPDHLDPRWRKPFNDEIRTGLNFFYERSLSALARRMAELPRLIAPVPESSK